MKYSEYEALLTDIREAKEMADRVKALGGFSTRTVQSDKVGYLWEEELLGDQVVKQTYIPDPDYVPDTAGSRDDPLEWAEGIEAKNGQYVKTADGKVFAVMQDIAATTADMLTNTDYLLPC